MSEEKSSGRGERDWPRTTWPVEEWLSDGALKAGNLLADGGLRVAQGISGPDERALVGDGAQGREVSDFDVLNAHKHKHK